MSFDSTLPFARGDTYFGIDATETSASEAVHLEGRTYWVKDGQHNTGQLVKLRVVRNQAGASIDRSRRGGVRCATGAKDFGRKISGYITAQGKFGYPIDDAYGTNGITGNDLFYVVERGPCNVITSTATATLAQHADVTFDKFGRLDPAISGDFVLGRVDVAVGSTETGVQRLVHVGDPASANR